jgi:hypothetical protein
VEEDEYNEMRRDKEREGEGESEVKIRARVHKIQQQRM